MKKSKQNYAWLGKVPIGIGAILKGWDILKEDFKNPNCLPVVDFRAMTPSCPHDCFFCFTDKNKKTLSLKEIKRIICEIKDMGARGIDFLGEGEPTIDKDFFEIVEFTSSLGVIPVVFTEAATKLRNRDFVRRLKASGASVVPKCDSMLNLQYQNEVVKDKTGKYFDQRNKAVELLIEEGFNEINPDGTTRLGFDMVISNRNINEVENMLKVCRQNNIYVMFSFYLPSGRSAKEDFDQNLCPTLIQIQEMQKLISEIDKWFGFKHQIWNNFATIGCVERLQIYGDGRVSPCPGNETIIGKVQDFSIRELNQMILSEFPAHNPCSFNGNCIYR
jgi:MoaA/NifB/PqqE/SkfB family radical SAM enzyme